MTVAQVRRHTPRKKRLASLLVANTGVSMQDMMLQAGYSPSTARARYAEIMGAVREEPEVVSHLERLQNLRSKMLDRMEATIDEAPFNAVVVGLVVIEKSIRLAEGKAAQRVEASLSNAERQELDQILKGNE